MMFYFIIIETKSRAKVKEAMGFALDHADASADVVGVLKESLLVPETPIHGEGHWRVCVSARPRVWCVCVYLACLSSMCLFVTVC